MGRAAGDSRHYTFSLLNANTGRHDKSFQIKLPSSSTIVKETLAAPGIVYWAERVVRDTMYGLYHVLDPDDYALIMEDYEDLEQFLKDNKLNGRDLMNEAAKRGTEVHAVFERAMEEIKAGSEPSFDPDETPYHTAIFNWIKDYEPIVIDTERTLVNVQDGYAGTCDLICTFDESPYTYVVDLKTRREGLGVYDSDEFQVDSYALAYSKERNSPDLLRRAILVAEDGGRYRWRVVTKPFGCFLTLKNVWDLLEEGR